MPIARAVAARFDEAIKAGHGEEDMAAVYRAARI
jgi:3-hydroxyisobutyrate dehydrogenase-like beta-hydroxyacid dehydrogenase